MFSCCTKLGFSEIQGSVLCMPWEAMAVKKKKKVGAEASKCQSSLLHILNVLVAHVQAHTQHNKHTKKTSEGTITTGEKKDKLPQTELYRTRFLWNSDTVI